MDRQAVLERKVELLEARIASSARPPPAAVVYERPPTSAPVPGPAPRASSAPAIPKHLATVKLAPPDSAPRYSVMTVSASKSEPSDAAIPRLSVATDLKEPGADEMARLLARQPEPGAASASAAPAGASAEDELRVAQELIRTGSVERGAAALVGFADHYPQHAEAARALYTAGKGLQTYGDLQAALGPLTRVIQEYPAAPEVPEAMLRTAECHRRLKRPSQARAILAQVMSQYPGTSAARAAEAQTRSLAAEGETAPAQ